MDETTLTETGRSGEYYLTPPPVAQTSKVERLVEYIEYLNNDPSVDVETVRPRRKQAESRK
jgi:hypothetical protein